MLTLKPIQGEQTLFIMPRSNGFTGAYENMDKFNLEFFTERVVNDGALSLENSLCLEYIFAQGANDFKITIRRDGDGYEQITEDVKANIAGSYISLNFIPDENLLQEDSTYALIVTVDGALFYRDKIYCTSVTKEQMRIKKHVILNNTVYKPYNEVDDNTYII